MGSDSFRGLPAGGAIGYRPTGWRARGATAATGRGIGAFRLSLAGASTTRPIPRSAVPVRHAAVHRAADALGPIVADRDRDGGSGVRAGRGGRNGDPLLKDARFTEPGGNGARRTAPAGGPSGGATSVATGSAAWTGERHAPDVTILAIVLALTALGILMVLTSSAMGFVASGRSPWETAGPQLLFAAVGTIAMLGLVLVPYRVFRRFALPALVLAAVALALLHFAPGWVVEVGGSAQWLQLPGLPRVQPGEFAKLAMILYLASWMQGRGTEVGRITGGFIPFVLLVGPFVLAIALTPDIGSSTVLAASVVALFFIAGGSLRGLGVMVVLGIIGIAVSVSLNAYQLNRLGSFLDPFADAAKNGYQAARGVLSLVLGGVTGTGLGDRAAAGGLNLPNAHNDYIFAVVGQETGFAGGALVIIGFLVLAWRGIAISRRAPTTFGALLAGGITAWLCVQAFINIGVVVALLPVTGITLPFVSAGGSSLLVSLVAAGILLSVSRETFEHGGWVDASGDRGRRHGRAHLPGPRRRPVPLGAPGRA